MKIKEVTERECCERDDLKPYLGRRKATQLGKYSFCKHCGQLWLHTRVLDAAGGYEDDRERVELI